MIEASCGACGTLNRVADADVPAGTKFIACSSCKARVALPVGVATASKPPAIPAMPGPKLPPKVPTVPAIPAAAAPSKAAVPVIPVPVPPAGGNRGDVIDLADLPAPKRASALGAEASRPAPKSGLAAAAELADADLPAPRRPGGRGPLDAVAAKSPAPPLELDDLLAPPGASLGGGELPAPKRSTASEVLNRAVAETDLPAPKRASGPLGKPFAEPCAAALPTDLPMPKGPSPFADLPMPKGPSPFADLPMPKAAPAIADLPAPKKPAAGIADLPAPKRPSVAMPADLPMPKGPVGISDLPMPKGPVGISDLPMPKGPVGISDLPMPKGPVGISDLPMPKAGGHAELPATNKGRQPPRPSGSISLDLDDDLLTPRDPSAGGEVAPKGFFDDLPQPASNQGGGLPAPKGFFDDLPQPSIRHSNAPAQDLAPKGFFDDLPQPAANQHGGLPAPKGFFDDLPQPALASTLPAAESAPRSRPPSVANSLFDDIPIPTGGHAIDLDPGLAGMTDGHAGVAHGANDPYALDLGLTPGRAPASPQARPGGVDLGDFGDLELPKPSVGPGIRFDATPPAEPRLSSTPSAPSTPQSRARGEQAPEVAFELEGPAPGTKPRAKAEAPRPAESKRAAPRRTKLIAAAIGGVLAIGGGGFVLYTRHAATQGRQDELAQLLTKAQTALATPSAGDHWQTAASAARQMLELDDGNGDALGISAEAAFAAAIDLGLDAPARIGRGKQQLATALAAGLTGPALDRAQALQGIATRQPDRAIAKLTGLVARSPKDGLLKLYLGWAYHTKGNDEEAIKAYDQALLASPALKVPILYARGQAKLARVDLAGARADFAAVLETAKDHVGAQVGLAAALPATQATQREADLLAILHRADVDKVDPRAIGLAWVLAGDEARRGGRLDTARGRYREALKKAPTDGLATAGLAEVELRDGKIDAAAELITKALTQTPDEIHAQLVAAEIEGRQKKYEAAEARLTALDGHQPALGPIDAARVKMIRGEVAEVQDKLDAALTAYTESAQLAGEIDLTPTMAAVKLLGKMADAAQAANPAHATELRDRAGQLLGKLAERAETEPALALTLGLAYMQAGDDAKAEQWTRKATVARPNDLEAQYQLAKTLRKLGRGDEALDVLRRAAKADPSRLDLGLDLARAYEDAKRDADAEALYTTLLNSPNVTVEIRGRAGRFAARRGKFADAGKQGEEILKLEPSGNAVGFYLRGEGLLAAGHVEEARKAFQQAVDLDPDPQYYDGQGRAAETLALAGDTKLQDNALIAYKAAIDALEAAKAPAMFNPLAGRGRIYLVRGEAEKALPPLLAANKLKPDDAEVLYGIGLAYQKIGQAKVAVEWLVRSTQVAPSADASYLLGTLYYDLNEAGPAAAALTTATRLGAELAAAKKPVPWLTDALYLLGRIEYDLHDEAAARRAWELFLSQNPSNQTRIQEVKYQLSTGLRGR